MDIYVEFNSLTNLLSNVNYRMILPAIAGVSVIGLFVFKLYSKIRQKFPIQVNCWFCNGFTSVPYNSSNSWYCPHCDQYNGFGPDGSYNRLLPEQFNEKLNFGGWCTKTKQKNSPNGLCQFCNINLQLKIQQLAQFVPLNKDNYDEEVQLYSDKLERVYRLCSRCQVVLEKTLKDKQNKYFITEHSSRKPNFDLPSNQPKEKERHSVYLGLTATLCVGLLLSAAPPHWLTYIVTNYPLPGYITDNLSLTHHYFPERLRLTAFLCLGVTVQLFDCVHMKDIVSFINLILWAVLLALHISPIKISGLISTIHMISCVIFVITSIAERKRCRAKTVATVKPVQLQKLDAQLYQPKQGNTTSVTPVDTVSSESVSKPLSKSPVSDPKPTRPVSSPSREHTPEDFGFGKLNVSPKRVTRSQTKHFSTKRFDTQMPTDLFRPKPVNLTPPKLQFEHTISDYQIPLTRSSSQSSGFVSLSHEKDFEENRSPSHQKYFDDYRSPSVVDENIESISQCGRPLVPYQMSFRSPMPFSQTFGDPFSNFPPYAIVHFTPQHFSKFYQYPNMTSYNSSLNMSAFSMQNEVTSGGWFQHLKNTLSSILFLLLITTNAVVLWKVLGEDYFNSKTNTV